MKPVLDRQNREGLPANERHPSDACQRQRGIDPHAGHQRWTPRISQGRLNRKKSATERQPPMAHAGRKTRLTRHAVDARWGPSQPNETTEKGSLP